MGGSIHEGGRRVSDLFLTFSLGSLFGSCVMSLLAYRQSQTREIEQRNEIIAACSNTRRLAYASGYNDGKLDIQRGVRS